MIAKNDLLTLMQREFATTLKVMRAFPNDQHEFRPHDRSSTALLLMSTFVFEMWLLRANLLGDAVAPAEYGSYAPDGISGVIADFENESTDVMARISDMSDEDYAKTISFADKDFDADAFALMMLHDQIHHRGQLTVYVRMAGGLVPSVYGPSADDSGKNL